MSNETNPTLTEKLAETRLEIPTSEVEKLLHPRSWRGSPNKHHQHSEYRLKPRISKRRANHLNGQIAQGLADGSYVIYKHGSATAVLDPSRSALYVVREQDITRAKINTQPNIAVPATIGLLSAEISPGLDLSFFNITVGSMSRSYNFRQSNTIAAPSIYLVESNLDGPNVARLLFTVHPGVGKYSFLKETA